MLSFQMALEERNFRILDILIDLTQKMVEGELISSRKSAASTLRKRCVALRPTRRVSFSGCARLGAVLGGME